MKTIKAPKTVTIKRSKWLRGGKDPYMRNPDTGKMCCLGFLARKAGLSTRQINDKREPEDLAQCITGLTNVFDDDPHSSLTNTATCLDLMCANDENLINDEAREKEIKKLGKKIGVTFKFED